MVVDDAESVGPAGDEVADRLAGEQRAVRGAAARLVLRALAVRGATILARALTAATVVRIADVTGQALAAATMALRHAARVRGAGEAAAERQALEHAEGVRSAALAGVAVDVADAVGHGRFLAGRLHRVPLVAVLALAGRAARYVDLALLIGAAHHFAAGVHAVARTAVQLEAEGAGWAVLVVGAAGDHGLGRLATFDQVARITLVSVDAQARGHVVLRDAQRVRSALQLAAGVHALANALADLEADLLRLALEIVGATAVQVAALVQVIGVAAVTGRAHARTVLADGSRAALDVAAPIYALVIHASVVERTGHSLAADAARGLGARDNLHLLAADERIAEEAVLAVAVVASQGVDAYRVAAARVPIALVDV